MSETHYAMGTLYLPSEVISFTLIGMSIATWVCTIVTIGICRCANKQKVPPLTYRLIATTPMPSTAAVEITTTTTTAGTGTAGTARTAASAPVILEERGAKPRSHTKTLDKTQSGSKTVDKTQSGGSASAATSKRAASQRK